MTNVIATVTNVAGPDINGLDVVLRVNEFYNSAFNQLLVFLSIVVGFAGIVVPILMQFQNRREIRLKEEAIEAKIEQLLAKLGTELKAQTRADFECEKVKFDKEIASIDERVGKQIARPTAHSYFLHANTYSSAGQHNQSVAFYCWAIRDYLKCEDLRNCRRATQALIGTLTKITKQDLESTKLNLREALNKTLAIFEKANSNDIWTDVIEEIKAKISQAEAKPA